MVPVFTDRLTPSLARPHLGHSLDLFKTRPRARSRSIQVKIELEW